MKTRFLHEVFTLLSDMSGMSFSKNNFVVTSIQLSILTIYNYLVSTESNYYHPDLKKEKKYTVGFLNISQQI